MRRRRRVPEVHLFILWSEARREESQILADLSGRFTVLDIIEVEWTQGEVFARSLSRMYGDSLPPGSAKEVHCGTGPMLAVVVEDPRPRYRLRRHHRRATYVNSAVFDARRKYRLWTGDGYRIHASDSVAEADRNLVLMFGERGNEFRRRGPRQAGRRHHPHDTLGTDGWRSVDELVLALEVHGGEVVSRSKLDGMPALTVRTKDVWWAEHIAGGRPGEAATREVSVGGKPLMLTLLPVPGRWGGLVSRLGRRWNDAPATR